MQKRTKHSAAVSLDTGDPSEIFVSGPDEIPIDPRASYGVSTTGENGIGCRTYGRGTCGAPMDRELADLPDRPPPGWAKVDR